MTQSSKKHIFITGGVVSSLGKGITAAALANLLKARGYKVQMQKLDPYLNVDPGTMSPYQHGEVYVTDDGAETDLDLGHYERFADITCTQASNYTSGRIYSDVIARERRGGYLGGTVQVIPHITNEIKRAISSFDDSDVDIVITEIGGTAGDIESLPFLEAIRQYRLEVGMENGVFVHLVLVPYIKAAGEMKTKPAQQSFHTLRSIGIMPDMLVCRCERAMEPEHFEKLSMFCNVPVKHVFEEKDVSNTIYEVPLELAKQDLDTKILDQLRLPANKLQMKPWEDLVERVIANKSKQEVEIAVCGKYTSLNDAYKSIYEALTHAGFSEEANVKIRQVEAEDLETKGTHLLDGVHGVLVPGGFGDRGVLGKMLAIRYARENNIPFFGICLGMQTAVMEFARNVAGMEGANSTEFNEATPFPVIDLMLEQKSVVNMGGTMRLGAYDCELLPGTLAHKLYDGQDVISERHRHRYEFNNRFKEKLEEHGMVFSGRYKRGELCEIVELPNHPHFIACQYHPEFKSRPMNAHPLFKGLVAAAKKLAASVDTPEA